MDAPPELNELESLYTIALRELEGFNPARLLVQIRQLIEEAVQQENETDCSLAIDPANFVPPTDAEQIAEVQAGMALALTLIRREAADNKTRKAEYDAAASQEDAKAYIEARQEKAARSVRAAIRKSLSRTFETLEAKTVVTSGGAKMGDFPSNFSSS